MRISVDAVISPLSVEYNTVVVKVMVLLPSVEQVASDSSKLEEVHLQEHISWIAAAIPVISKFVGCHSEKCYASSKIRK